MALETIYKTVNDNGEYSCGDIGITKEEWFELLKDNDAQQYRDALFCFLRMPDHAATCTEVAKIFGNSPKHYNAKIMNFAKWTQKRLNRFQVIGTDGEPTYWCIPMKCGHDTWQGFNWQLRDELVEALQYYLMKALIIRYREREPFNGFREEYKWALLDETEGKGVLDIIKILPKQFMGGSINLIDNARVNGVLNHLIEKKPIELTAVGERLIDETKPVDDRLAAYKAEMKSICPSSWNNYANDERTASVILTCINPDQYTFYKDEIYRLICQYFGFDIHKPGKKFSHFMEIINGFVADFGEKVQEIMLPQIDKFKNKPLNLAVQTMFWCMRGYIKEKLDRTIKNYWLAGFSYGGTDSQLDRFISNGIWECGYNESNESDKKLLEETKGISEGDIIILKSTSTKGSNHDQSFLRIKAVGIVTKAITTNKEEDGVIRCQCCVDYINTDEKDFDGATYGSYRKTIHRADSKVQAIIDYVNGLLNDNEIQEEPMQELKYKEYIELLKETHNLVLTGAPGTGKTYMARAIAEEMGAVTKFVQFHPSYDYTDFVEGLRPVDKGDDQMGFKRRDGVFKKFCREAIEASTGENEDSYKVALQLFKNDLREQGEIEIPSYLSANSVPRTVYLSENNTVSVKVETAFSTSDERILNYMRSRDREVLGNDTYTYSIGEHIIREYKPKTTTNNIDSRPFVFIIDEINRGEASKIFGELFFAIDPGYRGKTDFLVQTQYQNLVPNDDVFAEGFYVPENVYILATMNDIDRSVESMDFAMRRRFTWHEITPNDTESMLDELKCADEAKATMHRLNAAIAETDGLGAAYMIGPAYFLKLKDNGGDFDKLWKMNIEPLLKEYLRGFRKTEEILDKFSKAYFDKEQEATTGHPALDE
jgi:DNA polymerase III delta prime subunit